MYSFFYIGKLLNVLDLSDYSIDLCGYTKQRGIQCKVDAVNSATGIYHTSPDTAIQKDSVGHCGYVDDNAWMLTAFIEQTMIYWSELSIE